MGSGTSTVLIVGWHELNIHPSGLPHQRRMELLRERLSQHLTALNVPHQMETVPRLKRDRSGAREVIERISQLDRPIVVCCEWDIDADDFAVLENLHRTGDARVLQLSTAEASRPLPAIVYQQAEAGSDLARHCLAAGYRRILYFSPFRASWSDVRGEGVLAAARHARIPVHVEPSMAAPSDWQHLSQEPGEQEKRLRRTLERGLAALNPGDDEYTAIIACCDRIALAVRALQPGLRCGLAGFDDEPSAARPRSDHRTAAGRGIGEARGRIHRPAVAWRTHPHAH